MDVESYLTRLGIGQRPEPTIAGLFELQPAHMTSVPFENLDVFLGVPLSLEPDDLYDKVVNRRRGGYCFELNSLYGALLSELGFNATPVLGRVLLRNPPQMPPRNHMLHIVEVGGERFVTDVGFGGGAPLQPLNINNSDPVDDGHGLVRIEQIAPTRHLVQRQSGDEWQDQYVFTEEPAEKSDIVCGSHFTETHPSSDFRTRRFVGLFTESGHIGVFDRQLTMRSGAGKEERILDLDEGWIKFVRSAFGIDLDLSSDQRARLLREEE